MRYKLSSVPWCAGVGVVVFLLLGVPSLVAAQTVVGEEHAFELGIEAFESEYYDHAALLFSWAYGATPDHPLAAPAMVMAAKAHYRNGALDDCLAVLNAFERTYSTSPYEAAIRQLRQYVQTQLQHEQVFEHAVRLGVVLPLTEGSVGLSRALLAGIRVAVDEYNRASGRTIQILFRDSKHTRSGSRRAVTELAEEEVHAIIGPLFSEEADAAAAVAEREGVVLVAPLATDAGITSGRRLVFQANPTIGFRGQYLAEWGARDAGFDRYGIVADASAPSSVKMAEAFQHKAESLGVEVAFFHHLISPADWIRMTDIVGADTLGSVDALYLAVHATRDVDARIRAEAALKEIQQTAKKPHILGSEAFMHVDWTKQPSDLVVSYVATYDDRARGSDVRSFAYRMEELGMEPGRLATVGHDVTSMLLDRILEPPNVPLATKLLHAAPHHGIGSVIHFAGDQRNQMMFLFQSGSRRARRGR